MQLIKPLLITIIILVSLAYIITIPRSTYAIVTDPTGQYTAKVTSKMYLSLIPMSPGSSSDKAGFVEIFDSNSHSMGEVPVPMLQLANINWHPDGASVDHYGEWDFKKGICYHWNEKGTHKVIIKSP